MKYLIAYCKPKPQIRKDIFCKNQVFFHHFSCRQQGKQQERQKAGRKVRQEVRKTSAQGVQEQEIPQSPRPQEQGHEEPDPALPQGRAQQENGAARQQGEKEVRQEAETAAAQPAPGCRHKIVAEPQQGAAGQ